MFSEQLHANSGELNRDRAVVPVRVYSPQVVFGRHCPAKVDKRGGTPADLITRTAVHAQVTTFAKKISQRGHRRAPRSPSAGSWLSGLGQRNPGWRCHAARAAVDRFLYDALEVAHADLTAAEQSGAPWASWPGVSSYDRGRAVRSRPWSSAALSASPSSTDGNRPVLMSHGR